MSYRLLPSTLLAGPAAERAWRLLALTLMAVVGALAFSPNPAPMVDTGWDKLNHLLAFVALGMSARLGFPGGIRWAALLAAGLLAYGGAIELLQPMVSGHVGEWADLLADALGIAAGIAGSDLLRRMSSRGKPGSTSAKAPGR